MKQKADFAFAIDVGIHFHCILTRLVKVFDYQLDPTIHFGLAILQSFFVCPGNGFLSAFGKWSTDYPGFLSLLLPWSIIACIVELLTFSGYRILYCNEEKLKKVSCQGGNNRSYTINVYIQIKIYFKNDLGMVFGRPKQEETGPAMILQYYNLVTWRNKDVAFRYFICRSIFFWSCSCFISSKSYYVTSLKPFTISVVLTSMNVSSRFFSLFSRTALAVKRKRKLRWWRGLVPTVGKYITKYVGLI